MHDAEDFQYKWAVLILASLTGMCTWGLAYTIPVHYLNWNDHFDAGKAALAVVGGMNTGTAGVLGPVFDLIQRHWGYRKAGALGGILMMIGYIGSSLATTVTTLCIFYGFILGFGFGLSYFCASMAINRYFIRQRSFAEGAANIGACGGGFCFTLLAQYLTSIYGWRGCLLVMAAIATHVVVFFQLMFPPEQLPKLSLDCLSNSAGEETEQKHSESDPALLPSDGKESRQSLVMEPPPQRYWDLFKDPVFILMTTTEIICWLGLYAPIIHLPERARLLGIDVGVVAWIASSIPLSMTVGRLALTGVCTLFNLDPYYAYGFANVTYKFETDEANVAVSYAWLLQGVLGILTILSTQINTEIGLFCYAVCYGFLNVQVPLIRASAALLLGPSMFPTAYGWILAANGVSLFIGPALAGLLYDATMSYDYSFYFSGGCVALSGILTLLRRPAVAASRRKDDSRRRPRR